MVLLDMLEDIDFLHGLAPEYLVHIAALGQLQEAPRRILLSPKSRSPYDSTSTRGTSSSRSAYRWLHRGFHSRCLH